MANCATWHKFGRRPGAIEQRSAPRGAVEGPEAQEPSKMRRAAPRHETRGASIASHVGRNWGAEGQEP